MHLYNLTLQKSQAITHAVYGNFSGAEAEEFIVVRGKYLEVFEANENTGKIASLFVWECFGIIRDILPVRLAGTDRDFIALGSDSGNMVILKFKSDKNGFEVVQNEVYGKTGCRRAVPGQYLAKDPKGRAIMIAATEKQKLVYILDRDTNENLIISSPLEAHKSSTICFGVVGLDVEYENPLFASLEIVFSALEDLDIKPEERVAQKVVTFYELDLGLNTVTRKQLIEVDPNANMLTAVPGGEEGPGGCLVFSFNWVVYISEDQEDQVRAPFPRRSNVVSEESRDLLISCVTAHVQKGMFFFIAQSEIGDLYKITLDFEKDTVNNIFVAYFDTAPPATALCVSRLGFLFSASENGEHFLFTFKSLGDDSAPRADQTSDSIVFFEPAPLKHLAVTDELPSLAPLIAVKPLNPAKEPSSPLYALSGRGTKSSLKVLRFGLEVTEMAVSEVPSSPRAVFSLRRRPEDAFHSFIVVSFESNTLVLSIGEVVEEVSDTGLIADTQTLCAATLAGGTLLQAHAGGLRLIRSDARVDEWKPPGRKEILAAHCNGVQVAALLTGGEIALFEADGANQNLSEAARMDGLAGAASVSCVALAPVPPGAMKARFLAVGGTDRRVRLFDLEVAEDAQPRLASTQMLEGAVSSLVISSLYKRSSLSLFVGTADGRFATSAINPADGRLSSGRQRYLGNEAVKLFSVAVERAPAVLALSGRSWMSYGQQGRVVTMPLAYPALEHAAPFCSEQCPEGVVAVCENTLRIWTLEKLGEFFHTTEFKLRYTPRGMAVHPVTGSLIVCEAEHNAVAMAEREEMKKLLGEGDEKKMPEKDKNRKEHFSGLVASDIDNWASCLRLMDPKNGKTLFLEEFTGNLAVFSVTTCIFSNRPNEIFLIAGVAKKLKFSPTKSADACYIRVYRFFENHSLFKLLHQTEVAEVPTAFCPFQGQLLAGVGNILRLYDLGKRKLLRKSENRQFPGAIRKIHAYDNRIYVSDMTSGTFMLEYTAADKSMKIFADSVSKVYTTDSILVDYNTVASSDKFGNFIIHRLRGEEEDKLKTSLNIPYGGYLNSAGIKLIDSAHYYVGETITSLEKCVLNPGGAEVIIYSTIFGGIGVFYPLKNREDVDFFVHLETHMRQNAPPIAGRRHIDFRSSYFPVKNCVDGDLCEQFGSMSRDVQKHITSEMVMKDPNTIKKRIEILRSHII